MSRATRTPTAGKKKCGHMSCRKIATRVAMDGWMHVFLCDNTAHDPKGNWKIRQLTSPGAETYLEAP